MYGGTLHLPSRVNGTLGSPGSGVCVIDGSKPPVDLSVTRCAWVLQGSSPLPQEGTSTIPRSQRPSHPEPMGRRNHTGKTVHALAAKSSTEVLLMAKGEERAKGKG